MLALLLKMRCVHLCMRVRVSVCVCVCVCMCVCVTVTVISLLAYCDYYVCYYDTHNYSLNQNQKQTVCVCVFECVCTCDVHLFRVSLQHVRLRVHACICKQLSRGLTS